MILYKYQIPRPCTCTLWFASQSDLFGFSLENALRNWAALTEGTFSATNERFGCWFWTDYVGDVICVQYNSKSYELNVLEVKPQSPTNAISIIETDVMVDFAPSPASLEKAKKG